jgi:catechol 2,3-dioxygenase-like lactoylglutathione lyase family enzyme
VRRAAVGDDGAVTLTASIPALPVRDVAVAVAFYCSRLGFGQAHVELGFAVLRRDHAELHLWQAGDTSWRDRADLTARPVASGAESFLAGTASCRLGVDTEAALESLFATFAAAEVLHPVSRAGVQYTTFGVRQFHVLDVDGNLVTFFAPVSGA